MLIKTDHIKPVGDGLDFDANNETDTITSGVFIFSQQAIGVNAMVSPMTP